jgi:hypothetical protein
MAKEKDIAIDDEYFDSELKSLLEGTLKGKKLFYRFSKKWHGFIYSLHREDRLILLKMVLDICNYNECNINTINIQYSQSNIDSFFFVLTITLL